MKRIFIYLTTAALAAVALNSCTKDNGGEDLSKYNYVLSVDKNTVNVDEKVTFSIKGKDGYEPDFNKGEANVCDDTSGECILGNSRSWSEPGKYTMVGHVNLDGKSEETNKVVITVK